MKKLGYKEVYTKLEMAGIIDEIINEECQAGENLLMVKHEIVEGIKYIIEFTQSCTFKAMNYWTIQPETLFQRVAQKMEREVGKIMVKELHKQMKQFEYMAKL